MDETEFEEKRGEIENGQRDVDVVETCKVWRRIRRGELEGLVT